MNKPQETVSLTKKAMQSINSLASMSELSTVEYVVKKIVKAADHPLLNFADRKILYACRIYIKAGVDLSKYNPSATVIDEDNRSITIYLPHAKKLSHNMPHKEQKIVYEKVDFGRRDFSAKERNDLLIAAEEQLEKAVTEMGILQEAERNVAELFKLPLKQLGFQIININFK